MKIDDLLGDLHDVMNRGDTAGHDDLANVVESLLLRLEEHSELRSLWDRVYAATVQGLASTHNLGCATLDPNNGLVSGIAEAMANEAVSRAALRWSGATPEDITAFNDATGPEGSP